MLKLVIEDSAGETSVVPFAQGEITIGREESNTVRLGGRGVSRRHARVTRSQGRVFIEDMSSNGTRVNGDRIAGRAPIDEGDRIEIGDYYISLEIDTARTPLVSESTWFGNDEETALVSPSAGRKPAPVEPETRARLVIVSSRFAGREFALGDAPVTIGAADDNGVVIEHWSISQHHAKIVRESGRYNLVDLQSSYGVRVNGEGYHKVGLRKGDHVDLGCVRLRFAAPGEDFVFDRDAQRVDVECAKRMRIRKLIALIVVLFVLGFGAVRLMVRFAHRAKSNTCGVQPARGVASAPSSAASVGSRVLPDLRINEVVAGVHGVGPRAGVAVGADVLRYAAYIATREHHLLALVLLVPEPRGFGGTRAIVYSDGVPGDLSPGHELFDARRPDRVLAGGMGAEFGVRADAVEGRVRGRRNRRVRRRLALPRFVGACGDPGIQVRGRRQRRILRVRRGSSHVCGRVVGRTARRAEQSNSDQSKTNSHVDGPPGGSAAGYVEFARIVTGHIQRWNARTASIWSWSSTLVNSRLGRSTR